MIALARLALLAAVTAPLGCSSSSTTAAMTDGGTDAVADSGANDWGTVPEASSVDAAGVPGVSGSIACGTSSCALPGPACCASAGLQTDRACQPASAPCANMQVECDDSSECPSGSVCCGAMADGQRVSCVPAGACAVSSTIFIWCTSAAGCPASMPMCGMAPTGFSTCH